MHETSYCCLSFQNNFSSSLPSVKNIKAICPITSFTIISQNLVNTDQQLFTEYPQLIIWIFFFCIPHLCQRGWPSGHSADIIYCIVFQHQHVFITHKKVKMFAEPGSHFTWCSVNWLHNEIRLNWFFKKKLSKYKCFSNMKLWFSV